MEEMGSDQDKQTLQHKAKTTGLFLALECQFHSQNGSSKGIIEKCQEKTESDLGQNRQYTTRTAKIAKPAVQPKSMKLCYLNYLFAIKFQLGRCTDQ